MQPIIDISVQHKEWTRSIRDIQNVILSVVGLTLEKAGIDITNQELSLIFADNDFVQKLNRDWRGQDKPTNVLSFPQNEAMLLGDIILAYETVQREAKEQGKRLEDHAIHLIVHGLLHLLGYDHIDDLDAKNMENLEIHILQTLGIKNPYENNDFMA